MFAALAELLILPFALFFGILAWLKSRRAIPLPERNLSRASWGAFVLAVCVYAPLAAPAQLVDSPALAAFAVPAGGLALLYLFVGIRGSVGAAFDAMAAFWWAIGAVLWGALLVVGAWPDPSQPAAVFVLKGFYVAALTASVVRFALIMRSPPNGRLPNPAKVPGMPMAGPAAPGAAHRALSRGRTSRRPKFRT